MELIRMRVGARRALTPQITEFTLVPMEEGALAGFTPGAHVTVETPSGAMRRYSLVNDGTAPDHYKIAVKREPASRGGSASMHDEAVEGFELNVEVPENDFPMADAPRYLLIAGGIGVTPISAMAAHLEREGKDFNIIYLSRSAEEAAYLEDLTTAYGDRVLAHHDEGDPEKIYDFWDHFAEPQKLNVYCCGPKPLMDEIEAISGHWPEGRVNFEDFKPVDVVRADDEAFEVELKKSGQTLTVPADRSILEAMRDAGFPTVSSCESGTCGTCKTRLLEGEADHRDMVLMDEEKADKIMICVSRACSGGRLVLDL
ncbi:PDR/VanB family oxidoreductase [Salipiger sp. PrR002]|uniref:PDR/VanB family oxidoreductase n=1 Tax=Salipiger sp. PrR002 TaxID=2706489 RepID=UPI0013BC6B39|nr:PDR/VanB family oxidoreductase [Salipiger sp. PrR002]NDW02293.1 oxidoreductase [Salipiger sp. PrR002]NDW59344.1 oxidoreductase [Salipiger sp. PrR004]